MIVCSKSQLERYISLNKNFRLVLDFVKSHDIKSLECGKYNLDGENFVNVMEVQNKGEDFVPPKMEGHIKYIDIQLPIIGKEILVFDDILNTTVVDEYNEVKDVKFVTSNSPKRCQVGENEFMILFPEDAHYAFKADDIQVGKKAVFKIKV